MGLVESAGTWRIRTFWHEEDTKNFMLFLASLEGAASDRRDLQAFALYQEIQQYEAKDVAAGLQSFTEDLLLDYLHLNSFVKPYICVSGGVFANVRLNMRLRQRFPETQARPPLLSVLDMGVRRRSLCIPIWAMEDSVSEPQLWRQLSWACKFPVRGLAAS